MVHGVIIILPQPLPTALLRPRSNDPPPPPSIGVAPVRCPREMPHGGFCPALSARTLGPCTAGGGGAADREEIGRLAELGRLEGLRPARLVLDRPGAVPLPPAEPPHPAAGGAPRSPVPSPGGGGGGVGVWAAKALPAAEPLPGARSGAPVSLAVHAALYGLQPSATALITSGACGFECRGRPGDPRPPACCRWTPPHSLFSAAPAPWTRPWKPDLRPVCGGGGVLCRAGSTARGGWPSSSTWRGGPAGSSAAGSPRPGCAARSRPDAHL